MYSVVSSVLGVMPFFAQAVAFYAGGVFISRQMFDMDIQKLLLAVGAIQFGTESLSMT